MSHISSLETISRNKLCLILNVSVARACMLLWCIETGHLFLRLSHKMILCQRKLHKDITHVDTFLIIAATIEQHPIKGQQLDHELKKAFVINIFYSTKCAKFTISILGETFHMAIFVINIVFDFSCSFMKLCTVVSTNN